MKRTILTGVCALSVTAAVACNRNEVAQERADGNATTELAAPHEQSAERVSVTGCLTAQGDRFVLTKLDEGATPVASTDVYQLSGNEDDLRPHIGQMVEVTGEAPPPTVAQMSETTPAPAATSGSAEVSTTQTTRFEARTLNVVSVLRTDQPCPAAGDAAAAPR